MLIFITWNQNVISSETFLFADVTNAVWVGQKTLTYYGFSEITFHVVYNRYVNIIIVVYGCKRSAKCMTNDISFPNQRTDSELPVTSPQ